MSYFARLVDNERFYPGKFFLKSGHEIVSSIFKQNDKTERKKQEQSNPKQTAQQRHGRDRNLFKLWGQRWCPPPAP